MTTPLSTDFTTWRNKTFLGGYKSSTHEYYHSTTQTGTRPRSGCEKNHRDTQTIEVKEKEGQSSRNAYTQSKVKGYCQDERGDVIIAAKPYFDSEAWLEQRMNAALKIQSLYRGYAARCRYMRLRAEQMEQIKVDAEAIKARERQKIKFQKQEQERRLHPKSREDYLVLRNAIDTWHSAERVNLGPNPSRKALLDLEKQYTSLIQALSLPKSTNPLHLLEKASTPLTWNTARGPIKVDTQSTLQFRHLLILNHALAIENSPQRLEILALVKHTVKAFTTQISKDIITLVDRELDLNKRGRDTTGVARRMSTLFRLFCEDLITPPSETRFWCRGCDSYKPLKQFEVGVRLEKLEKCRSCHQMEYVVMKKGGIRLGLLLEQIKVDERRNGNEVLMGEEDLRFLVEKIWMRKSAISGVGVIDELALVRWKANEPLSPWNCVLLTKAEAVCHQAQPEGIYGEEFTTKVEQKLALGRDYYRQLPKMAQYAKEQADEKRRKAFTGV